MLSVVHFEGFWARVSGVAYRGAVLGIASVFRKHRFQLYITPSVLPNFPPHAHACFQLQFSLGSRR